MRFFSRQFALGRQFKTQGHGDYFQKNEKGSTEVENVSRNCLCKRVLFMGSLLGTHQSAMGTLFFFPASSITRKYLPNLNSSQFRPYF